MRLRRITRPHCGIRALAASLHQINRDASVYRLAYEGRPIRWTGYCWREERRLWALAH
jgi:hypothetical protein